MNGADSIKKAAINKAKQVAGASTSSSSNGQKKRRKGQDLKPIITSDSQKSGDPSPSSASSYVHG